VVLERAVSPWFYLDVSRSVRVASPAAAALVSSGVCSALVLRRWCFRVLEFMFALFRFWFFFSGDSFSGGICCFVFWRSRSAKLFG
jgi:hypothetical protein